MQKIILQVPVNKQLRDSAEKEAARQGFSSLQEVVRVFLTQLAASKVEISLQRSISLSDINEKRYSNMTDDFKSGKNVASAESLEDLMLKLNDN
jgi:antitoxin component of RelBE/YafQ-DinJ toxin-antitoxin module